jgi:hypothetical protein
MSALNLFNAFIKRNTCTTFIMFSDQLFVDLEIILSTLYRALVCAGRVEISALLIKLE